MTNRKRRSTTTRPAPHCTRNSPRGAAKVSHSWHRPGGRLCRQHHPLARPTRQRPAARRRGATLTASPREGTSTVHEGNHRPQGCGLGRSDAGDVRAFDGVSHHFSRARCSRSEGRVGCGGEEHSWEHSCRPIGVCVAVPCVHAECPDPSAAPPPRAERARARARDSFGFSDFGTRGLRYSNTRTQRDTSGSHGLARLYCCE